MTVWKEINYRIFENKDSEESTLRQNGGFVHGSYPGKSLRVSK